MSNRKAKWWVPLIRGPAELLRFIVVPLYKLLFGWADKRCAMKEQQRLASDVRLSLRFLFNQRGARVVANQGVPFPPGFDYAFVTVGVENLLFRFTRGLGELGVLVAPISAPSDWHDLSLVLGVVRGDEDLQRSRYADLWEVSRVLEPQLSALIRALSPEKFPELKQRLESDVYRWDRIAIKEAEAEINWRVYGSRQQ